MILRDLLAGALAAPDFQRRVFCGMTANVDYVIPFAGDDFLRAQDMFGSNPPESAAPPDPNLRSTASALDYAAWFMAAGMGGEADMAATIPVRPLMDAFPHFRAVGGTGIQAANWLAHAGFSDVVLYLPWNAPEFDRLAHPDLKLIDNNPGYLDLMADASEFSEIHCIIDYAKDTKVKYGGAIRSAPRHDRVILSCDRCNSHLRVSREFYAELCRPQRKRSAFLATGFNSPRQLGDFHRFVDECANLMLGYCRTNKGSSFIHVEDCYQWDNPRERRLTVAEKIWPLADSLGMNEVEYADLAALFELDREDVEGSLAAIAQRHGFSRVCLHGASSCRVVSKYPVELERKAIGMAILFSSARAYYGGFVGFDMLARLVEETEAISTAATAPDPVPAGHGYMFIETPTLYGMPVKSSIGLGDAFAAGQVAYL